MSKHPAAAAEVVDLSKVRERLRLASYQDKIARAVDSNRNALSQLFHSGLIFSREGTQAGRDLLLAHQHLIRVVSLVNQLTDLGDVPAPQRPEGIDSLYAQLDGLMARTQQLTQKSGGILTRLRGQ